MADLCGRCSLHICIWQQTHIRQAVPTNPAVFPASAIRNAISLGGDADTMACMAGGIAVATRGMEMPKELAYCVYNNVLDDNLRQILNEFNLYLKEHERE